MASNTPEARQFVALNELNQAVATDPLAAAALLAELQALRRKALLERCAQFVGAGCAALLQLAIANCPRIQLDGAADEEGHTLLQLAAAQGEAGCTEALLARGASVGALGSQGRGALHYAAWNGHARLLSRLLDGEGARAADACGAGGETALHFAAAQGHAACCALLLEAGADAHAANSGGRTALHCAAEGGQTAAVRCLLGGGADPSPPVPLASPAGPARSAPPLHLAAARGHTGAMAALLAGGADVHQLSPAGETALHAAAVAGSVSALKLLIDSGANVEACEAEPGRASALVQACSAGQAGAVAALLARGADACAPAAGGGPPLLYATLAGSALCVRTLLPRADLLQYSGRGETALHAAVFDAGPVLDVLLAAYGERYGRDQGVDCRTLPPVDPDADPGLALATGGAGAAGERVNGGAHRQTALHRAAAGGAHASVRKLLGAGAKRMALDSARRTPLHYAARAASLACIGLLVAGPPGSDGPEGEEAEGGAYRPPPADGGEGPASGSLVLYDPGRRGGRLSPEQVDARDESGQTALYYAAFIGSVSCARALLAAGADAGAARPDGYTPLSVAQMRHGANPALRELIVLLGGGAAFGRAAAAPLRLAPAPREALCTGCGLPGELAEGGKLKLCVCAAAFYCSKACQIADYPAHKAECKQLRGEATPLALEAPPKGKGKKKK